MSLVPNEPSFEPGHDLPPRTRVLVAEDDPISLELICARLKRWGFEAVATRDGAEAMSALEAPDAPTLAILDWMMPGVDGIEICRAIRASGRSLYIIIVTARGSKESIAEGLAAGADDYLVKPFDKDELHVRILVGLRVIALQATLEERLRKLDIATAELTDLKQQYSF